MTARPRDRGPHFTESFDPQLYRQRLADLGVILMWVDWASRSKDLRDACDRDGVVHSVSG